MLPDSEHTRIRTHYHTILGPGISLMLSLHSVHLFQTWRKKEKLPIYLNKSFKLNTYWLAYQIVLGGLKQMDIQNKSKTLIYQKQDSIPDSLIITVISSTMCKGNMEKCILLLFKMRVNYSMENIILSQRNRCWGWRGND